MTVTVQPLSIKHSHIILISPPSHTSYCSYLPVLTTYCKPFLSPSIWSFQPHSSLIALSIIPPVHPHQSHPFLSALPLSLSPPVPSSLPLSASVFSPWVAETDGKEVCNETAISSTLPKLTWNEWSHWSARAKAVQMKKSEGGWERTWSRLMWNAFYWYCFQAEWVHKHCLLYLWLNKQRYMRVYSETPIVLRVSCIWNGRWVQKINFSWPEIDSWRVGHFSWRRKRSAFKRFLSLLVWTENREADRRGNI